MNYIDIFYYFCTFASENKIYDLDKFKNDTFKFDYFMMTNRLFNLWEKRVYNGTCKVKTKSKDLTNYFNNGKPWNDKNSKELMDIVKLHELNDIGKMIGRTEGSIKSRVTKLIMTDMIKLTDIKSIKLRKIVSYNIEKYSST